MAELSSSSGCSMFLPTPTPTPTPTPATIPCPTANHRPRCLSARADLTSPLPRLLSLLHCSQCLSYLHPSKTYLRADPESKQLLSLCLHRLKKPLFSHRLRLVRADFLPTDPHSKRRINLRLRVQGALAHRSSTTIIEQTHVAEFQIVDHLCPSCSRTNASPSPDHCLAKVQLRQPRVPHRRTFLYLEQLILKHRAADKALRIQETRGGIDFTFPNRTHALKFLDFVSGLVPARECSDQRLLSHQHTFSLHICPVCRDDLVCLPPALSRSLGSIGPLVVCTGVTDRLALLDPATLRVAHLGAREYWRAPFDALMAGRQMVEYVVLDFDDANVLHREMYVQVARVSDFGKNDSVFTVRTPLGHLLRPGDRALGYDMWAANGNNQEVEKYKGLVIPDVILIKKSYEEKRRRRRGKQRAWKLKTLGMEVDTTAANGKVDMEKREDEYEQFLRDLEENPELRFNISLYRDTDYHPSEMPSTVDGEDGDDEVPTVPLDELLADLNLNDKEDKEGSNVIREQRGEQRDRMME